MKKLLVAILPALIVPMALSAQKSKDAWIGTWQLNVAKSTYTPGPGLRSETITIGSDGNVTVQGINSNGQAVTWSYTYSEGREVPITGMENASVIEKRTGKTLEHMWKMANAISTGKGVLSKNGKVMTYTLDGADSQGHHEHDVLVFDKQPS
jgi:hypothetical protein